MEEPSEDPDLRIAEGSWWPGRGSKEEVPGGFFVHSSGRENGRWGRAEKVEDRGVRRSSVPNIED